MNFVKVIRGLLILLVGAIIGAWVVDTYWNDDIMDDDIETVVEQDRENAVYCD